MAGSEELSEKQFLSVAKDFASVKLPLLNLTASSIFSELIPIFVSSFAIVALSHTFK